MTEPVQFVASIIAIASLAETVVTKGYGYLRTVKHCRDDVRKLMAEVNVLCGMLYRLKVLLQDKQKLPYGAISDPSNDVGHNETGDIDMGVTSDGNEETEPSEETLETPSFIYECERTLREIQCILQKFEHSNTSSVNSHTKHRFSLSALQHLQPKDLVWPLSKSKTLQLTQTLERHKSTCTIALSEIGLTSIHKVLMNAETSKQNLAKIRDRQEKILELQLNQQEEKVLYELSAVNAADKHRNFKRERHPGTGMWLFDLPELSNWLEDPNSALWIYGIPGAGKTTLSTLVVDEIFTHQRSTSVGTAYFYIRHDDRNSHNPVNVLGSIVSQLARQNHAALAGLMRRHAQSNAQEAATWDEHELGETLGDMFEIFDETYIMVDGLDESGSCLDRNRSHLIEILAGFHNNNKNSVRIIIFSRDEQDIRSHLTRAGFVPLSIAAESADLRLFANAWLEKLDIQSPDLRIEVVETLIIEANGMFMWVRAQIDYLMRLPNDKEKRRALKQLPPDLPQAYIRIFETIHSTYAPQTIKYIQRVLRWLEWLNSATDIDFVYFSEKSIRALRRLRLDALCVAICVENDIDWPTIDAIPSKEQVLRWMGCLVRWDQADDTVHLSHFTIKEFLSKEPESISSPIAQKFLVDAGEAERWEYIARVCLTYISHRHFECIKVMSWEETNDFVSRNPFYQYAALALPYHLYSFNDPDAENDQLIQSFLSMPPTSTFKLWESCHRLLDRQDSQDDWERSFHLLASPLHLTCASLLVNQTERLLSAGADPDAAGTLGYSRFTPLHLAICAATMELIDFDHSSLILNLSYKQSMTQDRRHGFKMVRRLVEYGGDVNRQFPMKEGNDFNTYHMIGSPFIVTPLICSFICKDTQTAQLLLDAGADWNTSSRINLEDAIDLCSVKQLLDIDNELEDIVQHVIDLGGYEKLAMELAEWQLLQYERLTDNKSGSPSSTSTGEDFQKPFINAFSCGKWHEAWELLTLHPEIDVDRANTESWYAIHYASQRTDDALELLLKHGANPNAVSSKHTTPLCVAAHGGYVVNLLLLLQFGAEPEYRSLGGWTPLLATIHQGHLSSLEALLDNGADIHAILYDGSGALHIAIETRDKIMISALLDRGVNCTRPDKYGTIPLHLACQQDDIKLAGQLLGRLASPSESVDAISWKYGTPLHVAANLDSVPMIDLLLSHGAKIDLAHPGKVFGSALMVACARGHTAAVASLLSRGAAREIKLSAVMSAERMARSSGQEEVLKVLDHHGRKNIQEEDLQKIDESYEQSNHHVTVTGSNDAPDAMDVGE